MVFCGLFRQSLVIARYIQYLSKSSSIVYILQWLRFVLPLTACLSTNISVPTSNGKTNKINKGACLFQCHSKSQLNLFPVSTILIHELHVSLLVVLKLSLVQMCFCSPSLSREIISVGSMWAVVLVHVTITVCFMWSRYW